MIMDYFNFNKYHEKKIIPFLKMKRLLKLFYLPQKWKNK